jgi:hypothetical protein
MLGAMVVGMLVTGAIFLSIVGLKAWDEVTVQYPTQALLAMAAGMTIPMVAWMLFRGMGRRNAYEMAAAMVLPLSPLPLSGLVRRHTERMVRGLLRDDDRGHVGADCAIAAASTRWQCSRVRTITQLHSSRARVYRTRRLPNL